MDLNEAVAKAVSAERAISGMTLRELSAKSGLALSTLMRIVGAERDIKVPQIERLADAFGIEPVDIMRRAEEIRSRPVRPAPVVVEEAEASPPTPARDLGPSGLPFEERVSHIDIPEHLLAAKGYAPGENPDDFDYDNIP